MCIRDRLKGYIAMENLVANLGEEFIDQEKQISTSEYEKAITTLLELLTFFEKNHVLNTDIKPSNFMRNKLGGYSLIDFGGSHFVRSEKIEEKLQLTPIYCLLEMQEDNVFDQELLFKNAQFSTAMTLLQLGSLCTPKELWQIRQVRNKSLIELRLSEYRSKLNDKLQIITTIYGESAADFIMRLFYNEASSQEILQAWLGRKNTLRPSGNSNPVNNRYNPLIDDPDSQSEKNSEARSGTQELPAVTIILTKEEEDLMPLLEIDVNSKSPSSVRWTELEQRVSQIKPSETTKLILSRVHSRGLAKLFEKKDYLARASQLNFVTLIIMIEAGNFDELGAKYLRDIFKPFTKVQGLKIGYSTKFFLCVFKVMMKRQRYTFRVWICILIRVD
eukprot:TRINITY_DN3282_c0_g1_i4.p1 TRINITY_DN3282_c0_g1~~TRINITY_DN3282_c0_g1_i4.p1  ORF type:complete len:389 (-),score=55.42 TRINITY_DN3282_c0_g1_i4:442-1608(-)